MGRGVEREVAAAKSEVVGKVLSIRVVGVFFV